MTRARKIHFPITPRLIVIATALFATILLVACGGGDSSLFSGESPAGQTPSKNLSPLANPGGCPAGTTLSAKAASAAGKKVTVCGPVAQTLLKDSVKGKPTFINFDKASPGETFVVVIWGENRSKFNPPPEKQFSRGKNVCVTGQVSLFKGKPQLEVSDPSAIKVC